MSEIAALGSASGSQGLSLVDITDPTAPVRLGGVSGFNADGLTWHGDYVLVVSITASTLRVIDASTPASPSTVASIAAGSVDDPGYVMDGAGFVRMMGNYAIVASNVGGDGNGKVGVVDLTTPTAPVIVGSIDADDVPAFAMNQPVSVGVNSTHAVVGDRQGYINVIDPLTDPTAPTVAGSLLVSSSSTIWGLDVLDGLAVVGCTAGEYNGISLIDISTPASPTVVGRLLTSTVAGLSGPQRITVLDSSTAVVSGRFADSVVMVDISTPSAPTLLGSYSNAVVLDQPMESDVSGSYAFVVGIGTDNLVVLDISTPAAPTYVTALVDAANFNFAQAFQIKPAQATTFGPTVGYIGPGKFMG